MFTIRKRFEFEAAHHLTGLAPNHPCMRPHGHSYRVEVVLQSTSVIDPGFVLDYRELDKLKSYINENLDHRDLNEIFPFQTTAENLAQYLFHWCKTLWPEVTSVSVSETQKTWATYSKHEL